MWERFWTPRRRRDYPLLLFGLLLVWWAGFNVYREVTGGKYGSDFVVFYAASGATLDGVPEEAYDAQSILKYELEVSADQKADPFRYPPPYLLLLAPLALLPYGLALCAWLGLTAAALAATVRESLRPRWWWAFPVAVFPAVAMNVAAGQNGFLTAALIGSGLTLVDRRPRTAGLLFGCLMYKPQFLAVALLGLVIGRRWNALLWASGCVVALWIVSYLILGQASWEAFWAFGSDSVDAVYAGSISDSRISALAFGVSLGLPRVVSQALHVATAALATILVGRVWIRETRPAVRNSVTVLGTILVSPYVFGYDLAMLIPVLGWLVSDARQRGWPTGQPLILGVCLCAPLASWPIASATHFQFGWLAIAALAANVAFCSAAAVPQGPTQKEVERARVGDVCTRDL